MYLALSLSPPSMHLSVQPAVSPSILLSFFLPPFLSTSLRLCLSQSFWAMRTSVRSVKVLLPLSRSEMENLLLHHCLTTLQLIHSVAKWGIGSGAEMSVKILTCSWLLELCSWEGLLHFHTIIEPRSWSSSSCHVGGPSHHTFVGIT